MRILKRVRMMSKNDGTLIVPTQSGQALTTLSTIERSMQWYMLNLNAQRITFPDIVFQAFVKLCCTSVLQP